MALRIIKPGVLDLVQDQGRFGYTELGINPGGSMDIFAASLANSLVGNSADKAVIEMHFPGPSILFTTDTLLSLTGADFAATLDDEALPLWHPVLVRKNSLLQCHSLKTGARAYLAVHGGVFVEKWLNSFSTNLKAGAGGFMGRKLEKGDELSINFHELEISGFIPAGKNFRILPWSPDCRDIYLPGNEMSILPGNEWELMSTASKTAMEHTSFTITNQSDRMGYRLQGEPLMLDNPANLITCPMSFGTIQLLPDGQLTVLMADHQTTGGYPKIAHVITAHLPRLAQMKAGEEIRFLTVDMQTAEAALLHMLKELKNLHEVCMDHFNQLLCVK